MTTVGTLDDQRTMTDSVRKWSSTVDPFTPLVGLVSLLIYVLNGFGGYLGRDLGLYVYAGCCFARLLSVRSVPPTWSGATCSPRASWGS